MKKLILKKLTLCRYGDIVTPKQTVGLTCMYYLTITPYQDGEGKVDPLIVRMRHPLFPSTGIRNTMIWSGWRSAWHLATWRRTRATPRCTRASEWSEPRTSGTCCTTPSRTTLRTLMLRSDVAWPTCAGSPTNPSTCCSCWPMTSRTEWAVWGHACLSNSRASSPGPPTHASWTPPLSGGSGVGLLLSFKATVPASRFYLFLILRCYYYTMHFGGLLPVNSCLVTLSI